jgi:hypothetical protein
MRLFRLGVGIAAMLAASTSTLGASAAPGKGDTGGKGGPGPDSSTKSGAEGTASTPGSEVDITELQYRNRSTLNPDEAAARRAEKKPWEAAATYELHRLLRQEDVAGSPKLYQLLGVSAKYLPTTHDTITLFGGATEGFIGDQSETGFRAQDLTLQYAHAFDLPEKFRLRTTAGLTAPLSYFSQIVSNITTPSISAALSRRFGDLSLNFAVRGAYFWDRYTTPQGIDAATSSSITNGTSANTKFVLGGVLSAEYTMPFWRPLSVGLGLSDSYYWYYNVGQCPAGAGLGGATGMVNQTCPGATYVQNQGSGQPVQQSYGGEIFARYLLPEVAGFRSDLTVAVGNPNQNFVLHDGNQHLYPFFRDTAEFYVALGGRY